jgi:hypothetical protein
MGQNYGVRSPKPMCFCFDALNPKCYSGTGTTFKEMITGTTATAVVTTALAIDTTLGAPHLKFTPGQTTRTAYIPFSTVNGVTPPTGPVATWSWWQYWQDQGNIDHPNIGWETGNSWDGINGFVFGTGWSTDGPRWGVAGTNYNVYGSADPDYQPNVWQNWTVTFNGSISNGLKTYLNGSLIDQRTPTAASSIAGNTNNLHIGATNSRGGNWGGYMDIVQMWKYELTATEVAQVFTNHKGRFGL